MRVLLVLVLAVGAVPAWADVSIQNDRRYVGDDGSVHIVGEIVNGLDAPIGQAGARVTLLDASGGQVAVMQAESLVNTVMPGMRGPFDLVLGADAASYAADVYYEIGAPKGQAIDVTQSEITRDGLGNLMITGTVANRGEITANTVSVVATLYDRNGDVAAVSIAHPEPDYLAAGDETFFLVTLADKSYARDVADYALVAESEEYAAVPEFPVGGVALLLGSLGAYVGVTRLSGRIIAGLISAADPR